jgi:hypothetical protein
MVALSLLELREYISIREYQSLLTSRDSHS